MIGRDSRIDLASSFVGRAFWSLIHRLWIPDKSIDLDFEKTESDIFENDEDIEELLERQEEIIEQARCLR